MEQAKLVVDAPRYWAAALVCALIAALAGLVTYWALTEVLTIELYIREFPAGTALELLTAGTTFLSSFVMAIFAAAILHLMMLFVVRPTWFFGMLGFVVIAVALLVPFTLDVTTESQVGLMILHMVIGLVTLSLLLGTIPLVTSVVPPAPGYMPPGPPPPPFQ